MKCLVYTCVFGEYDWIFPPILREAGLDYVVVTDDTGLAVTGWRTLVVDVECFRGAKAANLHHRSLIHRILSGYDYSLYVDGNIRLLGRISKFLEDFSDSGAAMGLYRHPIRSSVREEAETCLKSGKVAEPDRLEAELAYYRSDGFPDDMGLVETGIILKNHRHPDLDRAMALWWQLFEQFGTRDQITLPYVLWKTGVSCMYHADSFRGPNPYFGLYTHRGDQRAPRFYGYVEGRAYDSLCYAAILRAWRFSWSVRRTFRPLLKGIGGSR
ncbi:glycosyltransferase domain-containing protein [Desulfuromonas sp. TF]|uniref:glycosyltransferase domain-containing protein n=1 Tax=Desulfuromonas sp. TF TaxID=1232410 RepID=UPI00047F0ED3|nr:glycosyltransferase domain-containing protein [Desulfuromonas sp. TF]